MKCGIFLYTLKLSLCILLTPWYSSFSSLHNMLFPTQPSSSSVLTCPVCLLPPEALWQLQQAAWFCDSSGTPGGLSVPRWEREKDRLPWRGSACPHLFVSQKPKTIATHSPQMKWTPQHCRTCGQCCLYYIWPFCMSPRLVLFNFTDWIGFDNHICNLIWNALTTRKFWKMFSLHKYFVSCDDSTVTNRVFVDLQMLRYKYVWSQRCR